MATAFSIYNTLEHYPVRYDIGLARGSAPKDPATQRPR